MGIPSYTFRFAGESGEGVISAGEIACLALSDIGFNVFTFESYPAEIKGGHCWYQVRSSNEEVLSAGTGLDCLCAFNQEAIDNHAKAVSVGGLIIYDNTNWTYKIPKRVYAIGNFSRFMRPGSVVLTTSSTNSNIQATAVNPTSGSVALVLTNQSKSSVTVIVNLSNLANPPSSVTPYRTSSTENQAPLSTIPVNGGSLTITLPASSIVTLIG